MKKTLGRKSKFFWAKAAILFLSFLLLVSTLGVSLSLFRDNKKDEQSNDFAPIVLSDNSFNTLKSQVSLDMSGSSLLVQPVSFVVSTTSSNIYVRACVKLDGTANDARQKIAYESLTSATPLEGGSYQWTRFGEYYYLCNSSNNLVSLSSSNSGNVFNLLKKEQNIVPNDIVNERFSNGEKVGLSVTLQSVKTSNVTNQNVENAHSAFNAVEESLSNTKQNCSVYFYDANGLSLGNQTVAYGKGVVVPTPAAQSGKKLVGWNTKSDYIGATLDANDLASVYEDLVLYAEFDALTYDVNVIQPTDAAGNSIGTITPGDTTMRFGESLTFKVVPKTNFYIFGVYIRIEETKQVKNIGSLSEFVVKDYTSDITIWADISQEVVFLDINGGTGAQPKITFNEDKTKFVLSETEPTGPDGKEFYYYSTNPLDNEMGQNGIRIDLGVEYPLSYLEGNKTLYAIYLTPTTNYTTAANYIVVPKTESQIGNEGSGEQNMFGIETDSVKFITLPRSVKKIGANAFKNLEGLTGLSMSTVVDTIGAHAFENCSSISQFAFGPFVNTIGEGAFKNCVSLSTLKNFEEIPTTDFVGTFEGCSMLVSVTMPSGATKLAGTFKNCNSLMEVVLPNGLRQIDESTFENCTTLESIKIPSSVSFFGARAFRNCVALSQVEGLVDVVAVEIADSMFENCISLTQISIPKNTATIGEKAFNYCSSLSSITNLSSVKIGQVMSQAFANCSNLEELVFNGSLSSVGSYAFQNSGLKKVVLSSRLKTLGESAFEDCANLSSLTQLGTISTIETKTFKNCSSLFNILIPATVQTIKSYAFEKCSALTTLTIPASVQTIQVDALKNASGLTSITLQGDLPEGGTYNLNSTKKNWYYDTNPTEVLDKKGYYTTVASEWIVQSINGKNYIVGYRGTETNITIPYVITNGNGETTYIYGVALRGDYNGSNFTNPYKFENVIIEEGIQDIFNIIAKNSMDTSNSFSYPCFMKMTSLKSITLPSTLSSISDGAFYGCTSLTQVNNLENTKIKQFGKLIKEKISDMSTLLTNRETINIAGNDYLVQRDDLDICGVFFYCPIEEIKLPSILQIIGACSFVGLNVKEITIPASVRAIGPYAFYDMENLESIKGLESCILDYMATVNGSSVLSGFAADFEGEGCPVFAALPSLKQLTLPTYATIYSNELTLDGAFPLISNCAKLETITVLGDWPNAFQLLTTTESSTKGINSYSWYLGNKLTKSANCAGTYSIFPGAGDSDWVVDENGMIIAYKGSSTSITIPNSVIQNGVPVSVVGVKSLKNASIVQIDFSEGLTKIDASAFKDMTRLKNVNLCSTLNEIGAGAFENCSSLSSIVLPSNTTNVGADIFKGCSSLKLIILNNTISTSQTLENISDVDWFYQNGSTSTSATTMKQKGLYSIYSSVATTSEWEVKQYAGKNFITAYLGSSKQITVPSMVVEPNYSSIYDICGILSFKKFDFTSITISEGIETIGLDIPDDQLSQLYVDLGLCDDEGIYFAFAKVGSSMTIMNNLSTLVFPNSLKTIGFYGLAGLKIVGTNRVLELPNISTLGAYALASSDVAEIKINQNATRTLSEISAGAFDSSTATKISIGYGPTLIGESAFANCSDLTELNLPTSVMTILDGAFDSCSSLTILDLKYARQIGSISDCSALEKIILGASLNEPYPATNISGENGTTWFYEGGTATAITNFDNAGVYLSSAPNISTLWTYEQVSGNWYITGYTGSSTTLVVPSSITTASGDITIQGIKSLTLPAGVAVESLTLSEGIKEVLANALNGKSTLSKVVLPSSLTSIGANAFSGTSIEILTLGCSSLTLSAGALDGMSELEIINVTTATSSSYTLPTSKTWTHITSSGQTTTTTLSAVGIYTTLTDVATTNDWIVGEESGEYYIAGYKKASSAINELTIPSLIINNSTLDVYQISKIKSLKFTSGTPSSLVLKIAEGITKIDTNDQSNSSATYSMTDVLGETYSAQYGFNSIKTAIKSIEFPSTLIEIGSYAFSGMSNLETVVNFENTVVKTLKANTFGNNNKLTQISLPASLQSIDSTNFAACDKLSKIVLNSNLTSSFGLLNVGNGNWYYNSETTKCINMQKAGTYSSSPMQNVGVWVVEKDETDGKYYITAYLGGEVDLVVPYEIYDDETGRTLQIYGVRGIGKKDLKSITFEEGIEVVGQVGSTSNIFGGQCEYLANITMPSTTQTINGNAFDNISAEHITITIYGSQKNDYDLSGVKDTEWYHISGKSLTETETMSAVGSYTTLKIFAFMPDQTTFTELLSKETIEERKTVVENAGYVVPEGATYTSAIDNAWYVVNSETLGVSTTNQWYMYGYLGSQQEVVVPHYVWDYFTTNGTPVLRRIDNFITLSEDVRLEDITKFELEAGYTRFGGIDDNMNNEKNMDYAPASGMMNSNVEEIVLPSTIKSIGAMAFAFFLQLEKIVGLENTQITQVPFYAFAATPRLKKVVFPTTVRTVGMGAFYQSGVLEIEFNEGLTTLEALSMVMVPNLKTLTIPSTLSVIPAAAFEGQGSIAIDIMGSLEKIIVKKDLASAWDVETFTNNQYHKDGSQETLSSIASAGIYLSYECGTKDVDWRIETTSDGKNYITKYLGDKLVVDVPAYVFDREKGAMIEIYGVKSIGNNNVRKLTFREGIKSVGFGLTNLFVDEDNSSSSNNILSGNNTLTYALLPSTMIENTANIFDSCNALESLYFYSDPQTAINASRIKNVAWYRHNDCVRGEMGDAISEYGSTQVPINDGDQTIELSGAYSTYSLSSSSLFAASGAVGGYGITTYGGSKGEDVDIFVPAFALYLTNSEGQDVTWLVPVNSVISLRGVSGQRNMGFGPVTRYSEEIVCNSLTFAEGITRIGDKGNKSGLGSYSSLSAFGPVVNKVNKVGSEDKINLLPSSFTSGTKITLNQGTYIFEAMATSTTSGGSVHLSASFSTTIGSSSGINSVWSDEQNSLDYVFVKFDVGADATEVTLNIEKINATCDCISLYRVDKGLPTTLTVLGANAFSTQFLTLSYSGSMLSATIVNEKTGLSSINLSQTAVEEIEMFALSYTFENAGQTYDNVRTDWSFDSTTNKLTYGQNTIAMKESSDGLFWSDNQQYTFNQKTNRLTTPDGTIEGRYFNNDGKIQKEVLIAVPKTLKTIGNMGLNTGATKIVGLEDSALKEIEVGAFGGDILDLTYLFSSGNKYEIALKNENFGDRLVELNFPKTFDTISCSNATDIVLGTQMHFWGDDGKKYNYPTEMYGYAFASNSGLKNINVDAQNATFSSVDGVLMNNSKTTIIAFPGGRTGSYTMPDTVTRVGEAAFFGSSLTSVTVSSNLEEIGDYAFAGSAYRLEIGNLSAIDNLENSKVKIIGRGAFAATAIQTLSFPQTLERLGAEGDIYETPISGAIFGGVVDGKYEHQNTNLTFIVTRSILAKTVSLQFNSPMPTEEWWLNFSDRAEQIEAKGIYSSFKFEREWQVEKIDGNWWIVAYLGEETNLVVPSVTFNNSNEIVEVHGVRTLDYDAATSIEVSGGIKEFGYSGDEVNILGTTSNSTLSSVSLGATIQSVSENALLGLENLECVTLASNLIQPTSCASTGRDVWYHYANGTSTTVSSFQNAGIYTPNELQKSSDWVVDSEGYITEYVGTQTSLVVPRYILSDDNELISVIGIKSFGNNETVLNNVTSVTLSGGLKTIKDSDTGAFNHLTGLTEIHLCSTLEYIGENALKGCSSLVEITIPGGVKTIAASALPMDQSLTTIKLERALSEPTTIPTSVGSWFYENEPTRTEELGAPGTYKKLQYTIIYHKNVAGNAETTTRLNNLQGKAATLKGADTFINGSQKFLGWSASADSMVGEYAANAEVVLVDNRGRYENGAYVVIDDVNHTVNLYAIWQKATNIAILDNDWSTSSDSDRGFAAIKFAQSTYISSSVNIDLSQDIVLTGSFKLNANNQNNTLVSLGEGSNVIKLTTTENKKLVVTIGGTSYTSASDISENVAYSYFIQKSFSSVLIKVLKGDIYNDDPQENPKTFWDKEYTEDITNLSATTTATYVLGNASNASAITYGTAMLFENNTLKCEFMPTGTSSTMIKYTSVSDAGTNVALTNSTGSASAKLNVLRMLPTYEGARLPKETAPVRYGHTFKGYVSTMGGEIYNESMSSIESYPYMLDVQLKAKWEKIDYTINYDANGGSGSHTQTVNYDSKFTPYQNDVNGHKFTKTGYTLSGWSTNNKATEAQFEIGETDKMFDIKIPNGGTSVTLYAIWTANTYTVNYNGNGNTGGSTASSTHTYDVAKALTANGFTKTGYTFAGWATSASGNAVHEDKEIVTNLTATNGGTVTLYAKWTANTYTVQYYDTFSNTTTYTSQTYTYDDSSKTFPTGSLGSPWTFVGWATSSTATSATHTAGSAVHNLTATKNGTVKLYSVYKRTITLAYNANGGSGSMSSQTNQQFYNRPGAKYTSPTFTLSANSFTRTGYAFNKWDLGAAGATYTYPGNQDNSATVTAKAQWTANTYTVTFNPNGGSVSPTTKTVTYDSTYGTLPTPTRTGYTFVGWKNASKQYKILDYIESTGTQYINTGFSASGGMTVEYSAVWTNLSTGGYIVGSHDTSDPYGRNGGYLHSNGQFELGYGNTFPKAGTGVAGTKYNVKFRTLQNEAWLEVDGARLISSSGQTVTTKPVYVFTNDYFLQNPVSGKVATCAKVYYVKIWNASGTLVRNYVPYLRISDNVAGLFDLVNGVFYTNAGTGSFTAGTATSNEYVVSSTKVTTASNHTLTADWTINSYNMTIDPNNDSATSNKSFNYNTSYLSSLGTPTKTGYTFNGWRVGQRLMNQTAFNGTSTYINLGRTYMYTDKLTIAVRAYMDDWKTFASSNMRLVSCTEGGGWNFEPGSNNNIRFACYVSGSYQLAESSVTLAQMSAGWHTFVATFTGTNTFFYIDGMLVGSTSFASSTIGYNSSNTILVGAEAGSSNTPAGNYFKGTIDYVTIVNNVSYATSSSTQPAYNTVAIAQWTPNTYTVAYNGNGATGGSTASSTHTYDVAKALTANGFTRTGYTFAGWATSASGSVVHTDKKSVTNLATSGTITLYAKWDANTYYVTYKANGGTGNDYKVSIKYGQPFTALNYNNSNLNYSKTGYSFSHWTEASNGGTSWAGYVGEAWTWSYTRDISLYAQWTANKYTVTLNPNGGSFLSTTSVTLSSSTGNYNLASITNCTFAPSTTYKLTIGTATRTAGSSTQFTVRLFDFTDNKDIGNSATGTFGQSNTLTLTSYASLNPSHNNQILIYAGVAGSTAGVGATFSNISLVVSQQATYDSVMQTPPSFPTRTGYKFAGYTSTASPTFTSQTSTVSNIASGVYRIGVGGDWGSSHVIQQNIIVKFMITYTSTSSTLSSIDINDVATYGNSYVIDNTNKIAYGMVTITSSQHVNTYSFIDLNFTATSDVSVVVNTLQICTTNNLQVYTLKGTTSKVYNTAGDSVVYAQWIPLAYKVTYNNTLNVACEGIHRNYNGVQISYNSTDESILLNGTMTGDIHLGYARLYNANISTSDTIKVSVELISGSYTHTSGCFVADLQTSSKANLATRTNIDFSNLSSGEYGSKTLTSSLLSSLYYVRFWVWHNAGGFTFNNLRIRIAVIVVKSTNAGTDYVNYDQRISTTKKTPTLSGVTDSYYYFWGYYSAPNGRGTEYVSAAMGGGAVYKLTQNITLYAYWIKVNDGGYYAHQFHFDSYNQMSEINTNQYKTEGTDPFAIYNLPTTYQNQTVYGIIINTGLTAVPSGGFQIFWTGEYNSSYSENYSIKANCITSLGGCGFIELPKQKYTSLRIDFGNASGAQSLIVFHLVTNSSTTAATATDNILALSDLPRFNQDDNSPNSKYQCATSFIGLTKMEDDYSSDYGTFSVTRSGGATDSGLYCLYTKGELTANITTKTTITYGGVTIYSRTYTVTRV